MHDLRFSCTQLCCSLPCALFSSDELSRSRMRGFPMAREDHHFDI